MINRLRSLPSGLDAYSNCHGLRIELVGIALDPDAAVLDDTGRRLRSDMGSSSSLDSSDDDGVAPMTTERQRHE